jgi:sugar-specific transcriptional regulator TrmB
LTILILFLGIEWRVGADEARIGEGDPRVFDAVSPCGLCGQEREEEDEEEEEEEGEAEDEEVARYEHALIKALFNGGNDIGREWSMCTSSMNACIIAAPCVDDMDYVRSHQQ